MKSTDMNEAAVVSMPLLLDFESAGNDKRSAKAFDRLFASGSLDVGLLSAIVSDCAVFVKAVNQVTVASRDTCVGKE